ncbi:hypothetical protein SAZ10_29590 [Mesorhizobium sp. BAC0120]|uniref:hypothetical protein n=1 Tax=Mesorhizobium sp. BAC0120 TaxID=3090670 RepID=UPI00298CFA17|nr:hypothetical protein [Mesorhizobium sp. BAC0120]MDW6025920.1 hypothetical protein [Mesorhizobium sp. BAC0120]
MTEGMGEMKLSRRAALWLLGGGAASVGAGYAAARSLSDEHLVQLVLERYLGPLKIAADDLRSFTQAFRRRNSSSFPTEKLADVAVLLEELGLASAVRPVLPGNRAPRLEHFERWLLAEFQVLTSYAHRQSPDEPVRYLGPRLCMNPFAKFDLS